MCNVSATSWREQIRCLDDGIPWWWYPFDLDQHAYLDLQSASSLHQQSAYRQVARLGHIILISDQSLHLSLLQVFSGVRVTWSCVTRSLVLCVCFVDRCLSFWTFSFGHCVVCPSSIYGFWLSLWYLQTLLCTYILMFLCHYIDILPVYNIL